MPELGPKAAAPTSTPHRSAPTSTPHRPNASRFNSNEKEKFKATSKPPKSTPSPPAPTNGKGKLSKPLRDQKQPPSQQQQQQPSLLDPNTQPHHRPNLNLRVPTPNSHTRPVSQNFNPPAPNFMPQPGTIPAGSFGGVGHSALSPTDSNRYPHPFPSYNHPQSQPHVSPHPDQFLPTAFSPPAQHQAWTATPPPPPPPPQSLGGTGGVPAPATTSAMVSAGLQAVAGNLLGRLRGRS